MRKNDNHPDAGPSVITLQKRSTRLPDVLLLIIDLVTSPSASLGKLGTGFAFLII